MQFEPLHPVVRILIAGIAIVAAYYDIRWRRLPNWLTLPAFLVGFVLSALLASSPLSGLRHAGYGVFAAAVVYFPLYLLRGMGAGDVKLMAAVGALVGWRDWLAIFILSGLVGGVIALFLMVTKGRVRRTFVNTGHIVWEMVHFRPPHLKSFELDVSDPRAFTLPHGAVIALGVVAFLGLHVLFPPV